MKFVYIALMIFFCCSSSAMEVEELQPLLHISQNLGDAGWLTSESDDSSEGTFDDFCVIRLGISKVAAPRDQTGLGLDMWGVIFNYLSRKDRLNLCYVSHYFHNYVHPLIYLDILNDALQLHIKPTRFSCRDFLSQNYIFAQQVAKVAQITERLQEISNKNTFSSDTPLRVKNVMGTSQEAVHKLLEQVELRRYGPLFQIGRGRENFDYLKKTYDYDLKQKTKKVLGYILLSDPIAAGVCMSGLIFGAVLIGEGIYWSAYNQLLRSQDVDYRYIYPCRNCTVESVFYNRCPGNSSSSCFLQWPGFRHFEKIIGNKNDWIAWIDRACAINKTFLWEVVNNVTQIGEYANHSRISSADTFTSMVRKWWGDSEQTLFVKQVQTNCYVKKVSGYNTYAGLSGAFVFCCILFNIFFFVLENMG